MAFCPKGIKFKENFDIFWNVIMPSSKKIRTTFLFINNLFSHELFRNHVSKKNVLLIIKLSKILFVLKCFCSLIKTTKAALESPNFQIDSIEFQFKRYNIFHWICSFKAKNISSFVAPSLKLYNQYCRIAEFLASWHAAGQTTMTKHVFFF